MNSEINGTTDGINSSWTDNKRVLYSGTFVRAAILCVLLFHVCVLIAESSRNIVFRVSENELQYI